MNEEAPYAHGAPIFPEKGHQRSIALHVDEVVEELDVEEVLAPVASAELLVAIDVEVQTPMLSHLVRSEVLECTDRHCCYSRGPTR